MKEDYVKNCKLNGNTYIIIQCYCVSLYNAPKEHSHPHVRMYMFVRHTGKYWLLHISLLNCNPRGDIWCVIATNMWGKTAIVASYVGHPIGLFCRSKQRVQHRYNLIYIHRSHPADHQVIGKSFFFCPTGNL